jgi:hypothetical protein
MMRFPSLFFPVLLSVLAACGGGGSAASSAPIGGSPGSVHLLVDTATGSDALVQFQVAAVAFERADGSLTGNVLPTPAAVTFADPSGEADGLLLQDVPTGDYASVHLLLAPGSGVGLYSDGTMAAVTGNADLEVPLAGGFQHSATARGWLAIGHNGGLPPTAASVDRNWALAMSGRTDGSAQALQGLRIAAVQSPVLVAQAPVAGDGALQVEFAAGCSFDDHPGGRDDFLRACARGDDVSADGTLHRDGRFVADHVRRSGRANDGPRLLGRIGELRPATTSFVLQVQAEVRRGGRRLLPTPVEVLVDASLARMHASDTRRVLTFGELATGQLAKVEWTSRTPVPGNLELVVAREIEVASSSVPMSPEWEGAVQSVDLNTGTIVVVPRGNDPIVVSGQSVASVDVHVGSGVPIERRELQGPGRSAITLGDVQPGSDRIWWRGTVTGPAAIDATWVRVRQDD